MPVLSLISQTLPVGTMEVQNSQSTEYCLSHSFLSLEYLGFCKFSVFLSFELLEDQSGLEKRHPLIS